MADIINTVYLYVYSLKRNFKVKVLNRKKTYLIKTLISVVVRELDNIGTDQRQDIYRLKTFLKPFSQMSHFLINFS